MDLHKSLGVIKYPADYKAGGKAMRILAWIALVGIIGVWIAVPIIIAIEGFDENSRFILIRLGIVTFFVLPWSIMKLRQGKEDDN